MLVSVSQAATIPAGQESLVEDFAYPDRDKLLAEKGLKLVSGDGHITLTDCATGGSELLRLNSRADGNVCFTVTGPTGYLALEVEKAFLAKSDTRDDVMATVRTEDPRTNESKVEEIGLEPGIWEPVGEGVDPELTATVLELSVGEGKPPTLTGDTARPWLGRVLVGSPGQPDSRGCTASLVDRSWIVTAANCFSESPGTPVPTGTPTREATVLFAGKAPVRINYLVPRDDRDVVLARLVAPLTDITPAVFGGKAAAQGAALTAAGYGRTGTRWVPDAPHAESVTQSSTTDSSLALTGGRMCKGDAGGPVLDGSGRIVAVQSASDHSGCLGQTGTGTSGSAARTDNIGDWLVRGAFAGKAQFRLDEVAGSRRVVGGEAQEFTAALAGGAESGVVGKVG
ncbi:S1 family peptidase, partial [Streptomyces sp. KL109B]